jgi:pSer/pThr/pTyr-binding forkhead associated (FHA) protein
VKTKGRELASAVGTPLATKLTLCYSNDDDISIGKAGSIEPLFRSIEHRVCDLTADAVEVKKGGMALITLRVLDGADRGQVFADVPTPLTIGREEGNPIQLNDERISRFHLKIQEDQEKIVLTDLQSTNGTKVNGESVQLWVLRPGDVIALGRTLVVFGSREEIAQRLAELRGADLSEGVTLGIDEYEEEPSAASLDFELNFSEDPDAEMLLHTLALPELPESLSPGQAAQLAEMLQYFNLRLRGLMQSVRSRAKSDRVTLDQREWQNLIDLQDRLAGYLRRIGEPGE